MNDHELSPIGDEVKKQLEQLQEQAAQLTPEEVWTEEDKGKLDTEVAAINFIPDLVPGFADRDILVDARAVTVHEISNFPINLALARKYRKAREEKDPQAATASLKADLDPNQAVRLDEIKANQAEIDRLFTALASKYPYLYRKISELSVKTDEKIEARKRQRRAISAQPVEQDLFLTEEEQAMTDFYFSVALDAVAEILGSSGRQQNISETITFLVR